MANSSGHNNTASPEETARAQGLWHNFTVLTKWGVIATVASLVLMSWFLL